MLSKIISFIGFLCTFLFLLNVVEVEPIRSRRAAERIQTTTSAAQKALQNSINIALLNCYNYGEFQYPKKSTSLRTVDEADCVNSKPDGLFVKPKEYPHMVIIGYGKDFKDADWLCSGSLISDKFVLSLANCSESSTYGPAKWAFLGVVFTSPDLYRRPGSKPSVYEIVKRHIHPNYDPKSRHNDIALFELNSTVAMSPYVRPACLYTSTTIPIGTNVTITSWDTTLYPYYKKATFALTKASTSVIEDKVCETVTDDLGFKEKIKNFTYDSKTMTCSEKFLRNEKNECIPSGDSGSPLQIPVDEEPCMWNIVGITLMSPTCEAHDKKKNPTIGDRGVSFKVAHYLEWIQKIVWP